MSSTPSTPAGTTRGATVGRALIVIGGVLAAVSSWLNWGAKTRELGPARTAYTIPAKFVIDSSVKVPGGGLSLGIVVLVLGVAVIVTGFLYVYQVRSVIHDHNLGKSVRDFISIGPYLVVIGGLL